MSWAPATPAIARPAAERRILRIGGEGKLHGGGVKGFVRGNHGVTLAGLGGGDLLIGGGGSDALDGGEGDDWGWCGGGEQAEAEASVTVG